MGSPLATLVPGPDASVAYSHTTATVTNPQARVPTVRRTATTQRAATAIAR